MKSHPPDLIIYYFPQAIYENVGDVPNVVFPYAALCDAPTGRIAIYYGAADTVTCLAFAQADQLIDFIKEDAKRRRRPGLSNRCKSSHPH